jgi:hypothetical protein
MDGEDTEYCDTKVLLDMNAIPFEAHAIARYHITSSYHDINRAVRQQNSLGTSTSTSTSTATAPKLLVNGLGNFF